MGFSPLWFTQVAGPRKWKARSSAEWRAKRNTPEPSFSWFWYLNPVSLVARVTDWLSQWTSSLIDGKVRV
jgi:hypothetical protein